jgi:hypothetical protein
MSKESATGNDGLFTYLLISPEDVLVTREIVQAGKLLDVAAALHQREVVPMMIMLPETLLSRLRASQKLPPKQEYNGGAHFSNARSLCVLHITSCACPCR